MAAAGTTTGTTTTGATTGAAVTDNGFPGIGGPLIPGMAMPPCGGALLGLLTPLGEGGSGGVAPALRRAPPLLAEAAWLALGWPHLHCPKAAAVMSMR